MTTFELGRLADGSGGIHTTNTCREAKGRGLENAERFNQLAEWTDRSTGCSWRGSGAGEGGKPGKKVECFVEELKLWDDAACSFLKDDEGLEAWKSDS